MRTMLMLLVVMWLGAGCAGPTAPAPVEVRFTPVALPPGTTPEVLASTGDQLLIGVRREGQATAPGLLRRGPDGTVTEIPLQAATGYGRTAFWYSLVGDGNRILGIGGDRGGAHGNVRWSVWTGSSAGVAEHAQGFSTFGGWGAGDLIDGVLTPAASAVVGSWQSDDAGLDVAVWTPQGDSWVRRSSTGTPLQSTRANVSFATAATASAQGVTVAGWQFATGPAGRQAPVVWQSGPDVAGWRKTVLPDAGSAGTAVAVRCATSGCAVAGRVDGVLALWRLAEGTWSRVAGIPPIPVGDADRLAAPLDPDGAPTQIVSDDGQVKVITAGQPTSVRVADGPTGTVLGAAEVGPTVYVVAGDPAAPRLWQTTAAVR
ncbi:MAG TPA: hypothetical protein VGE11_08495 [Pseudonocardia sp.]